MSVRQTRVTAVMITYNRQAEMLRSLDKLCSLPEAVRVILVDNSSSDGSAEAVARRLPQVTIIRSKKNIGAAARNLGVEQATTPYVALCDDDDQGRDVAAQQFSNYGNIPAYARMLERSGVQSPLDIVITGNEKTVTERIRAYDAVGVSDFCAMVFEVQPGDGKRTEELLASLAEL